MKTRLDPRGDGRSEKLVEESGPLTQTASGGLNAGTVEARLRRQEEQYRLLFETNPSPMWVFETEGLRILAVNQSAITQYGYARSEFLKLTLNDLRPTDDVSALHPMSHYSGEFRHVKKDGSSILVEIYSGAIVWAGLPARIVTAIDVTERMRAGERMRAILESALDCIITMDHEGRVVEFNPAAEKTFGYRRDEALGRLLADLVNPSALCESHQHGLADYIAAGQARVLGKRIELTAVRRDGSEFPVELAITRIGTFEPPLFTGFIRDISERRGVEEELRAAHKHLQHLLAHTPAVLYVLRIEGQSVAPIVVSENMERLLGVTAAESMQYEWWLDSLHPEDRERAARVLAEALKGSGYSMEYRIRHKDGTYHWVEDKNRVIRDDAGQPSEMVGIWTDITERKRTEERLREQADIIERAQDAIVVRDFTTDVVTVWNSGAERLYGWSASEAVGRPMGQLISAELNRAALVKRLVSAGEFHGETKHRAKDGHEVIVDARVTLIRNDDGTPRSVLGINTNITEQKKLEKQFLRTQRLESIGTLASGVAHDLNNILVPILMAAPVLRSDLSREEREKFLTIIEASAQRGANIVKQVLTFARGADGDRVLLQPIYLLEEIAKISEETFPKTIRVRTSYPEDLRLVEGDATQLHQVLLNLCVNARDAMPEGGTLSLTAKNFDVDEQYASMMPGIKSGPHVLISISDTGTGIPQHIIDKIFDPFFTTKEVGQGTGLGLSTALGIVKSHGGLVNVYSTSNGTTFRVLLPSAPDVSPADEVGLKVEIPLGHGETILVVDDESAIREVAAAVLSQSGYQVMVADDGPAALALFVQHSKEIDIVLADLVMPIMSGLMLARTLRKMDAHAKVIISTARDSDFDPVEMSNIGVQESLIKPYTRETLLRTVSRVLQNDS